MSNAPDRYTGPRSADSTAQRTVLRDALIVDGSGDSQLLQGVTLEVVGNWPVLRAATAGCAVRRGLRRQVRRPRKYDPDTPFELGALGGHGLRS